MKILCFADLHIGQKAYCQIDPTTGLHTRELKAIKILNHLVNEAISQNIDVVIFAGDMFKNSLVPPTLLNAVNAAFIRLSNAHIHTLVLDGNHDVSKLTTFSSGLHQFHSLKIPYIKQTRFYGEELLTFNNITYKFVFLPTYHTKQELTTYLSQLDTSYPTIIIGHLTIQNAKLNDWNIIDNEECIDMDIFKKDNILAVVLGHLHKHQILHDSEPLIFYCGSADRIDFSEEQQPKGYVLLNINNDVKHTFVPISFAQQFQTLKIDCTDSNDITTIEDRILSRLQTLTLNDKIVRLQVKVNDNIKINENKIISYAYSHNVQHLLKVQYILDKQEDTAITMTNALSTFTAVERYYEGQVRSKERIMLCKNIIERVDKNVS